MGDTQEKAFREVKLRLKNPPVLHLPRLMGDLSCIQIQVLKELVVHFGRFKKVNQIDRLC